MTEVAEHVTERATEQARRAAERAGVEVRPLEGVSDHAAAGALFVELWGAPGGELFDHMLTALSMAGNYLAGAYAGDGSMVGASVGFAALHGRDELHSHITGVAASHQGAGVGAALKLHQRAWSLARGIDVVTWTFDPLVRRNAVFNLKRLGAVAERYLLDVYGEMGDLLNAGSPSDRLLVAWWLADESVAAAADGNRTEREPAPGAEIRRVATPADVELLRRDDPEAARAWRVRLRSELAGALEEGFSITGLDHECAYVLERRQ
jgi:predicted GNAT superfamily acetyltransferase